MRVTAVIPVKALSGAKSRLGTVLGRERREGLVLDMLKHVLGVVRSSRVHRMLVVTCDARVGSVATDEGGDWTPDPAETLNASLGEVFRNCWEIGEMPLYLPADLPRLDEADVQGLVDAGVDGGAVVLSPSRDEEGTNALLVPPANPMMPLLGAGSFLRHLAQAKRLGIATRVQRSPGLCLDIDTPEDLFLLWGSPAGHRQVHVP